MRRATRLGAQISIALLCSVGSVQIAAARNIHVCPSCAHTSIQAAVNDAASDDVIFIAAGRYTEKVLIEGKHLTLIGAGGGTQGTTELEGTGHGPALVLGSGVQNDPYHLIEVHGLTISHGNHLTGTAIGGGVQVRAGAYLHIFDSTISQNIANEGGGIGVNTRGGPETTITRCLISDNFALSAPPDFFVTQGGGVAVVAGKVTIRQSTIARNQTTGEFGGGGISTGGLTHLSLIDSTVSDNRAITITAPPSGVSGGAGGGLRLDGDFLISGSTIANNVASGETSEGGGLEIGFFDSGEHTIKSTIITRNLVTGSIGPFGNGGGINDFVGLGFGSGTLTLEHVYVVENLAGGGLHNDNGITLSLIHSTIKDNVGGDCLGSGCPP
jgi:hypothetical protein